MDKETLIELGDSIDWRDFFKKVDENFINENKEIMTEKAWREISKIHVSSDFVSKNYENIKFENLPNDVVLNLPDEMLLYAIDNIKWNKIIKRRKMSDFLISEAFRALDIELLCERQKLSDNIINDNFNNFDIDILLKNQKLSPYIINKYLNVLPLNKLLEYQKVPEDIINEHLDELDIEKIYRHQKLSEAFLLKNRKATEKYFYFVVSNNIVSESFIEMFVESIESNKIDRDYNWECIVENQKLSEKFLKKYFYRIASSDILKYQKLSDNFILEFIKYLNLEKIRDFSNISEEFIEKYQNSLDWYYITATKEMNIDFIKKYKNRISFDLLIENNSIIKEEYKCLFE